MLLNQGRSGEIVLGAVMTGDPTRQNLVLVYQIGSERKMGKKIGRVPRCFSILSDLSPFILKLMYNNHLPYELIKVFLKLAQTSSI